MRQRACYLTALSMGWLSAKKRTPAGGTSVPQGQLSYSGRKHEVIGNHLGAILVEKLTTRSTSDRAVSSRNENRLTSSIQCRQRRSMLHFTIA
jgi:hypothetical protein